jgi:hypothetical protein
MPPKPSILRRAMFPALLLLCCCTAGSAHATPTLGWSTPHTFDGGSAPTGVSCASEAVCVAVDAAGNAFTTTAPGASAPSWSGATIDAGGPLQAVSCAPAGPCVAVDGHGQALAEATPGSSWSTSDIDGTNSLTGISCPASSLCVAVDSSGGIVWSTTPRSASWSAAAVDAGHALRAVSCTSVSLCVAVDADGRVLASTDPAGGGGTWRAQTVDFTGLRAVSCSGTECVAADDAGQVLASADPGVAGATWSITPVALEGLLAVSCAPSGLCAATGAGGSAFASDNAVAAAPSWPGTSTGASSLTGISCLSGGLCMAVDAAGRSISARPPAPAVSTSQAGSVGATGATLAGIVDPRDASLQSCRFEYGTSVAYGESIPCSAVPAATGGAQPVNASPSDLEPNTTHHFRLIATSASGEGAGADATFTTDVSSAVPLISPHPSISGTPAPGQTLTCRPGTEAGARVTLTYVWLRETVPVAGSTLSTYAVKGRDSGHHLQCKVTATDGGGSATASSSFVTVPAGGVPEAAGETLVGTAAYAKGKVTVPVACSAHASSGCAISARLTAAQTSAASRRGGADTLAATSAHLPAGIRRTIALPLTKAARKLLASRSRLSAQLAVSGTVIGVIRAPLAQESLALVAGHRATATKLSSRRAAAGAVAHPAARAAAAAHALAARPYMGWDTYFALGGRYSESSVLEEASRMLTLGLLTRGYRYVWLDVGWWHGAREADGQIEVSQAQWPHGLGWLTATLHAAGFLVGLYTDAGPNGCGGAGQGSFGHYQQDADTFAAWGFDAVKVDWCGGSEYQLEPAAAYASFSRALQDNLSHRPILLSICNFVLPGQQEAQGASVEDSAFGSYSFGPTVGNSWRTDTDVGTPGNVTFASVLRNMDADAAAPQAAGPGHWNDPDYLAPGQGMNNAQFRTQLSMWSMLAAPLMVSADLRSVSSTSLRMLEDREVLSVDQDAAGVQGRLISATGNGEVWARPLAGGARAVALLNRSGSPITIRTTAAAVGLAHATRYSVRDLWSGVGRTSAGSLAARVPSFGTVLLRVRG